MILAVENNGNSNELQIEELVENRLVEAVVKNLRGFLFGYQYRPRRLKDAI